MAGMQANGKIVTNYFIGMPGGSMAAVCTASVMVRETELLEHKIRSFYSEILVKVKVITVIQSVIFNLLLFLI